MKKCEYCAKEITYFEQYCCDECQRKAIKFYDLREKYTKLFSFINCVCIFGIPVGIFLLSFTMTVGFTLMAFSTLILGITVLLLPFPVENMISSMKIKKAVNVTKLIGLIILIIGVVLVALDFIFFLH